MTDCEVELPALDGREPLGFLAALGVLRLLADEAGTAARLRFSDRTASALITSPFPDLDAVADALVRAATGTDALIPGAPADFPAAKAGTGADPMRVSRRRLSELYQRWTGDRQAERWLSVLLTDLAEDNAGRVALTPYSAPSGQQSLRTFFEKPVAAVRAEPGRIREALAGWRRVDGFTGEYLDHRVLRSAADHPRGASVEAGVPGATWLAVMALPLFRLTGNGRTVAATCWHRVSGRREPVMVWPLWRRPLDLAAVQVLVEHPALRPGLNSGGQVSVKPDALPGLEVFLVCGAERQRVQGRNFAGVLAPVPISGAR